MEWIKDGVGDGGGPEPGAQAAEVLTVTTFEPDPAGEPVVTGDDGSGAVRRTDGSSEPSSPRLVDRFSFLRTQSPVPVYVGIALVIAGFAVIGYAWGRVAGLANVALQVPYLVSGGLTGLGCIMVGITVISLSAKRREAASTTRELRELREVVKELRDALVDDGDDG